MKTTKRNCVKRGGVTMKNLSAEMSRYGVRNTDIKKLLACSEKTVTNKLNGASEFSVSEAMQIRDMFFPGMRLEYLFSSAPSQQTEKG